MNRGNPNFVNSNVEISTIEVSQTQAANLLNVSRESVVFARKVHCQSNHPVTTNYQNSLSNVVIMLKP